MMQLNMNSITKRNPVMIGMKLHKLRAIIQVNHQFYKKKQLYDKSMTFPLIFTKNTQWFIKIRKNT